MVVLDVLLFVFLPVLANGIFNSYVTWFDYQGLTIIPPSPSPQETLEPWPVKPAVGTGASASS